MNNKIAKLILTKRQVLSSPVFLAQTFVESWGLCVYLLKVSKPF